MNVKVLLNTEVTPALAALYHPDAGIVATGSTPIIPPIRGIDSALHATDIYFKPESIRGDTIVIIGGGLVGVEAGLHLRNTGKNVTVLEMLDDYAPDAKFCYKAGLVRTVSELGLTVITGAEVKEIAGGTVTYSKDGAEQSVRGDTILYATGMKSYEQPYFDLCGTAPFVCEAGDCKKVGKVDGAVHAGFFAALDIGMI
jgi:pyruvate/2-oxoglutarate dehydrogenase complex dihydrolipoamide dehydrogenase (E3) component